MSNRSESLFVWCYLGVDVTESKLVHVSVKDDVIAVHCCVSICVRKEKKNGDFFLKLVS